MADTKIKQRTLNSFNYIKDRFREMWWDLGYSDGLEEVDHEFNNILEAINLLPEEGRTIISIEIPTEVAELPEVQEALNELRALEKLTDTEEK